MHAGIARAAPRPASDAFLSGRSARAGAGEGEGHLSEKSEKARTFGRLEARFPVNSARDDQFRIRGPGRTGCVSEEQEEEEETQAPSQFTLRSHSLEIKSRRTARKGNFSKGDGEPRSCRPLHGRDTRNGPLLGAARHTPCAATRGASDLQA